MSEKTIWGIHAGKLGDAETSFFEKNIIAIGWAEIGDLSKTPPNRDAFKDKIISGYPNIKPGAIPNNAGQLYRFFHEMKPGDLVIYPSRRDRTVNIGKIIGDKTDA